MRKTCGLCNKPFSSASFAWGKGKVFALIGCVTPTCPCSIVLALPPAEDIVRMPRDLGNILLKSPILKVRDRMTDLP